MSGGGGGRGVVSGGLMTPTYLYTLCSCLAQTRGGRFLNCSRRARTCRAARKRRTLVCSRNTARFIRLNLCDGRQAREEEEAEAAVIIEATSG